MHNLQPDNSQNNEELDQSLDFNTLNFNKPPSEKRFAQELEKALNRQDWDSLSERLEHPSPLLFIPDSKGRLLIERMITEGAPEGLIAKLADGGALNALPESKLADLLVLAVSKNHPGAIAELIHRGSDPNTPNSAGVMPLRAALLAMYLGASNECTRVLLHGGARIRDILLTPFDNLLLREANLVGISLNEDLSGLDLSGIDLVDADVSKASLIGTNLRGAYYSPRTKFPPQFGHPSIEGMILAQRVFLNDSEVYLSEKRLHEKLEEVLEDIPPHLLPEAQYLLTLSGSLQDVLLYREVYMDAVAAAGRGTGAPLQEFAPKLLLSYPPGVMQSLFLELDNAMDQYPLPLKYHSNEAELLLLCHHPKVEEITPEYLASLSLAISSIDRWLTTADSSLSRETLYNWGRVGQLAFSFPLWKFEAIRTESVAGLRDPSLLEEIGFELVTGRSSDHSPSTKKHLYGPGFALHPNTLDFTYRKHTAKGEEVRDFASECYVEFRRSYLLISHPTDGTLLIRNSSKDFGRDRFQRTAYWSPKGIGNGFTAGELQSVTSDSIHKLGFESILEPSLNDRHYGFQKSLDLLLDNLFALKDKISGWKFDTRLTSAWYQSPGLQPRLVGGYNSEGFPALVSFLERQFNLLERGRIPPSMMPELAFVRPDLPPWASHEYQDEMEFNQTRLRLNPERLQVLRDLAEGRVDEDALRSTGVYNFLAIGFETQSDLVLLAPK